MIIIEIKIIGSDCSNGMKLTKMVKKAIDEAEIDVRFKESNEKKEKEHFGVKNVPGLVINNKLVSEGKVLTVREIYKLIMA